MPQARSRPWLVCYDISDQRRLARVHRYLSRHAVPVQYSVFLACVPAARLRDILHGVAARIEAREDDVRAYPLMVGAPAFRFGRQILPEDVLLMDQAGGGAAGAGKA